jgi:hypothetical protein
MYKLFSFLLPIILAGCGAIPMLDFAGKGSLDKKIYYDVNTSTIISTYKSPINSFYLWKSKNDSTYSTEKVILEEPATALTIPGLKDSLSFYDFQISLHLLDDHWRMMHHLDLTKELVEKKQKIYSRFTSH